MSGFFSPFHPWRRARMCQTPNKYLIPDECVTSTSGEMGWSTIRWEGQAWERHPPPPFRGKRLGAQMLGVKSTAVYKGACRGGRHLLGAEPRNMLARGSSCSCLNTVVRRRHLLSTQGGPVSTHRLHGLMQVADLPQLGFLTCQIEM